MKLMQIEADQKAFLDLIDEAGGEITPENEAAIDAMIDELKTNVAEKADSLCNFIAHLESREAMFKERKEIFAKSAKAAANAADRVRDRFKDVALANGWISLSTPIPGQKKKKPGAKIETTGGWVVSAQYAGKSKLLIDETMEIPEKYLIYEEPKINTKKIDEDLASGVVLPFAKYDDRTIALMIK